MSTARTAIRRQLIQMVLLTSGAVLLLTLSTLFVYDVLTYREASRQQLDTLGKAIAANSTAALAFDNPDDAEGVLSAFEADSHITHAALYTLDGTLFAVYPRSAPASDFPAGIQAIAASYTFGDNALTGVLPVTEGSRRMGSLYLRSDLGQIAQRIRLYGALAAILVCASGLLAYALSRQLQHKVSAPMLELARTATAVSTRHDYSVRAARSGTWELDQLTDAFNHMLETIQDSEALLQTAYDDLRRSQQTIMQQERLRALGQIASGIAHDINNAISPVSLYTEALLEREPNLSERARAYLTTIQRAIADVAGTVARMREFYRPREPQLSLARVDLNTTVRQAMELTQARWSDMPQQRGIMIDLRTELSPVPTEVMVAEGEMRDALTNLIYNAVDAMPEGGTLTLRTRHAPAATPASPEPRVIVEVGDTGVGMDEATQRLCLEPFFTTKGERGSGLGLAMVYGMVKRHSAELQIDSSPGHGTTIRLLFAAAGTVLAPRPDGSSAPAIAPVRPLRILLVDDDPLLLGSLCEVLRADGHDVTAADGGQAGINAFNAAQFGPARFELVITDLGMPHVDGRRVAAAVKASAVATPVILLTGWGQRLVSEGQVPPHVDRVLNKPPRLHDLRTALLELS